MFGVLVGFFFSSRRRHTRYWRDWSSDVCSSDLTFDSSASTFSFEGNGDSLSGAGTSEGGDLAVAIDRKSVV